MNGTCPLPYPDRFAAAVAYVTSLSEDVNLSEESKLLLYALQQQATLGPCREPRPWGWNVVSNAKWQSWKQLGELAPAEAMRLYVRSLEEEVPEWWTPEVAQAWDAQRSGSGSAPNDAVANGAAAGEEPAGAAARPASVQPSRPAAAPAAPAKSRSVAEVVVEGSWVSPYISSDRRPPPRYEHAVALVGNQLFVIGGNCGGRYLADSWALNLENLTWSCASAAGNKAQAALQAAAAPPAAEEAAAPLLPPPGLPPVAGHAAVGWNGNIVAVGGHAKAKDATSELPVRLLDTKSGAWSALRTSTAEGVDPPKPRGGHSATLLGSKLYIFGGEDPRRKCQAELWTLDLATLEWDRPQTSGVPPAPRSAHSAASYRGRYILVFGGGSVASCFNDLHVLDTQTLEWSRPETEGAPPSPRAGHAAAALGTTLYVVGGGNNASGCADMYALQLSELGQGPLQWTLVGNTPPEAAIASEGLSLVAVPMAGCMVSFGGYNGKYHNAVHVYRPEGYAIVQQHATAAASAATGGSPKRVLANGAVDGANGAAASFASAAAADVEAAKREAAAAAAAAREAVALEVSVMRRQLDSSAAAVQEAERGLEEAREALATEQQRAMALEVEVAELRQQLSRMDELEREVARYRGRAAAEASRKTGLWGYITGEPAASQ